MVRAIKHKLIFAMAELTGAKGDRASLRVPGRDDATGQRDRTACADIASKASKRTRGAERSSTGRAWMDMAPR